eukprot:11884539-Alexandrium_andersonii.AAC.1
MLVHAANRPHPNHLAEHATSRQAFESGTARAQERFKVGPRHSRGAHSSALFVAQIPNLPTK